MILRIKTIQVNLQSSYLCRLPEQRCKGEMLRAINRVRIEINIAIPRAIEHTGEKTIESVRGGVVFTPFYVRLLKANDILKVGACKTRRIDFVWYIKASEDSVKDFRINARHLTSTHWRQCTHCHRTRIYVRLERFDGHVQGPVQHLYLLSMSTLKVLARHKRSCNLKRSHLTHANRLSNKETR